MRHIVLRAYARPPPEPKMPVGLVDLMEDLTRDVLKHNPTNLYEFCVEHMEKLLKIREAQSSREKSLTLEEKVRRAQDKVRERALKRRRASEKLSNEMDMLPCGRQNNLSGNSAIQNDENVTSVQKNNSKENGLNFLNEAIFFKRESSDILVVHTTVEEKNDNEVPLLSELKDESNAEIDVTQNSENFNSDNKIAILDPLSNVNLSSDSSNLKLNDDFTLEEKNENNDNYQSRPSSRNSDMKSESRNDTLSTHTHALKPEHIQTPRSENIKDENEGVFVNLFIEPSKESESKDRNVELERLEVHILPDNGSSSEKAVASSQIKEEGISFQNVQGTYDKSDINNEADNGSFDELGGKINDMNIKTKLENENDDIVICPEFTERNRTNHLEEIIEHSGDIIEGIDSPENRGSTETDVKNNKENSNLILVQSSEPGQGAISDSEINIEHVDTLTPEQSDSNTTHDAVLNSSDGKNTDINEVNFQNSDQNENDHAIAVINNDNMVSQINQNDFIFISNIDVANTVANSVTSMDNVTENKATRMSDLRINDNKKEETLKLCNLVQSQENKDKDIQVSTQDSSNDLETMVINKDSTITPLLENVDNKIDRPKEAETTHNVKTDFSKVKFMSSEDENINRMSEGSSHIVTKRSTSISEEMGNEKTEPILANDVMYAKATSDEGIDVLTKNYDTLQYNMLSVEGIDNSVSYNKELDFNITPQRNNHLPQITNAMDLETAAITIQKVFRSFLFRSRTSTLDDINDNDSLDVTEYVSNDNNSSETESDQKIEDNYLTRNTTTERPRIARMDTILQTVNEEKSLSGSTDDSSLSSAATIIQAHVRGFLTRNKLNSRKNSSTSSLLNSADPPTASLDADTNESQKNKTVLNIHIVPEGSDFLNKEESITASIDIPLDVSPPSSKLHPLGYDKSVRRKQLKREDAVQSVSPPSNNSGKLSEDEPVKGIIINETEVQEDLDKEMIEGDISDVTNTGFNSLDTTPTNSTTVETVVERTDNEENLPKEDSNVEQRLRPQLVNMSSDEMDVVTPFTPRDSKSEMLLHSGEFHDTLVPTRVVRSDSSVVREFKNVLVYFLLWNN